jgi:hypothetical protein
MGKPYTFYPVSNISIHLRVAGGGEKEVLTMKRNIRLDSFCLSIFLILSVTSLKGNSLPLDVKKPSERVMVISSMTGNNRVAIVDSSEGLLMINAAISPDFTRRLKKIGQKEFGSKPWKYLIQTTHGDMNIGGSQAFSKSIIISHRKTKDAIITRSKNLKKWLTWRSSEFEERVIRSTKQLSKMDPQSERARGMRQWIELCDYVAKEFKKDFTIPSANLTFTDELQLTFGNISVHLYFFGSASTDGQTFVWIPEEKFAWTSDVFHAWHILPHDAYTDNSADVKRWLRIMDLVLSPAHEVKHVFRCNGGTWTLEQLRQRRNLIEDIYKKTRLAEREGFNLEATVAKLANWQKEFPYLKDQLNYPEQILSIVTSDIKTTITGIWKRTHDSAARQIQRMMDKKGIHEARNLFEKLMSQTPKNIYFSEAEFNSLGYRYLNKKNLKKAIEIFRMNVRRYPKSANSYDSLGEAYMISGNKNSAIKNYQKSLDLNPGNENAKKKLIQLKKK